MSTQHAVLLRLREKRSRATRVPSIGSGVGTHLAAPSASARLGAGRGHGQLAHISETDYMAGVPGCV